MPGLAIPPEDERRGNDENTRLVATLPKIYRYYLLVYLYVNQSWLNNKRDDNDVDNDCDDDK